MSWLEGLDPVVRRIVLSVLAIIAGWLTDLVAADGAVTGAVLGLLGW